jgi:4-hydroxybenzoate polyprenyltransferase
LYKFIRTFYYGNIFLGICAVALCIETNLLVNISLNIFPFYLLIFFCTCIYYTMIYVRSVGAKNYNDRTLWYRKNLIFIKTILKYSIIAAFVFLSFFVLKNLDSLFLLSPLQIILIIAFPTIAAWYTVAPRFFHVKNIRQIGWIKPFIVGLTWAGWVTIYPVVIWIVQRGNATAFSFRTLSLLWLQNFLFFSVNAIIFDIKDYRTDSYYQLKTYPVILGIRKTFRFIIFPVTFLNLVVLLLVQSEKNFSILQTFIQFIPYALLIYVIMTYRLGRNLLYYLVAVDGLVFAKAICGIMSIVLLKKH